MRNSACIPAHLKRRRYTSTAAVSLSDSTRRSRWMTASMPTPCSPAHQFAQHWARPHTNRPLCCSAIHREAAVGEFKTAAFESLPRDE